MKSYSKLDFHFLKTLLIRCNFYLIKLNKQHTEKKMFVCHTFLMLLKFFGLHVNAPHNRLKLFHVQSSGLIFSSTWPLSKQYNQNVCLTSSFAVGPNSLPSTYCIVYLQFMFIRIDFTSTFHMNAQNSDLLIANLCWPIVENQTN